jgi:hypothetical protein
MIKVLYETHKYYFYTFGELFHAKPELKLWCDSISVKRPFRLNEVVLCAGSTTQLSKLTRRASMEN